VDYDLCFALVRVRCFRSVPTRGHTGSFHRGAT